MRSDRPPDPPARPSQRAGLVHTARERLAKGAAALPDLRDGDALVARFDRRVADVCEALEALYGELHDLDEVLAGVVDSVVAAASARPEPLRRLDHRREIDPEWFLSERTLGYVCYADRFADDLRGVARRLDYLAELGVTYLHLMPLLQPRDGEDDGGYAVADYLAVDSRLGTMDDLEALSAALRSRGMSLCIDLVLNHTAQEHEWARRARAGEQRYREYYLLFGDRALPDAYERTLVDVFPDTAPGSFTWSEELGAWVWTTFHPYQWDLDHSNPQVFTELLRVMLELANRGVDVLRLDAVPFLWKRMGTDCQNQPEAHLLLQAFRGLVGTAAPGVALKAEAIVPPEQLVQYLGAHDRVRLECDLAYHNQLMVMGWSMLASRDTLLARQALGRMRPAPSTTTWVTYVRGHDDIGWAVSDEDAEAVGLDGGAHRRFLADFYAGDVPFSFARGLRFQEDLATGSVRTSGTTSALCGVEQALDLGDEALLDQALRRIRLLYALAFAYGGTPLLWMGDEIALGNDRSWAEDPAQAVDNRWLHRPRMDWARAARRRDPSAVEGRVYAVISELALARRRLPVLRAGGATWPAHTDNPHVFAWVRDHPRTGRFLGVANVDDVPQSIDLGVLDAAGLTHPVDALASDRAGRVGEGQVPLDRSRGRLQLDRLDVVWLIDP